MSPSLRPILLLALPVLAACSTATQPSPALPPPAEAAPRPAAPLDACGALEKPLHTLRVLAGMVALCRSMPVRPIHPDLFVAELDAEAAQAREARTGDPDLAKLAADTGARLTKIAGSARAMAAARDAEAARTTLIEEMERGELLVALGEQRCAGGDSAAGRLSAAIVQRVVRGAFDGFKRCHEAGLRRDPGLRGTVRVRFTVGRDGSVSDAADADHGAPDPLAWGTSTGAAPMRDPEVSACVVAAFRKLSFPGPEGGTFSTTYPIELGPAR